MIEPHAQQASLLDEPGVANTLRVTLVTVLVSALAISGFTLLLGWALIPQLGLFAAVSCLVALAIGRIGRTKSAMLVVLFGITYVVMYAATSSGGMQNIGFTIIPVLIVVGSLVLERLQVLCFTAIAILGAFGVLAIRRALLLPGQSGTGDIGDFFIYAVTCIATAVVGRALAAGILNGFRLVRANESRYRRLFDNIQDVYCEMDTGGALLEISPAAGALFGLRREDMIGCPLSSFLAKHIEFDTLLGELRTRGRVHNRDLVIRHSGGALVNVLLNASLQTATETGQDRVIGSLCDITERERAEEAVRESEARLRLALEATAAGTFDYYPQSGRLICSEATKGHFGVPAEAEVPPDLIMPAVHPDDRPHLRHAIDLASVPDGSGQVAVEFRAVGIGDGKERWLAARGRMQFGNEGRPVRLIGTTLDISERKRLEEDLRQRAEELQTIMDVAPIALFVAKDPECRDVCGNRAANFLVEAGRELNLSLTTPGGPALPWRVFRDGADVPADELPLSVAACGVEVRDFEMETLLPSGKRKILSCNATPLYDASGRVRGAIAAAQDVTEARQRAQNTLRESEDRFRNTADSAPVIMWLGDAGQRLTFVNEQFVRFTGMSSERLLGDGWTQVIHPEDLDRVRTVYYEAIERRGGYQLEYRARRADGEYRYMLGTTSPRYVGSEYAGQAGSVIDITDLKVRQEQDVARQKLESVGMLASGIAHDFNNLLGGVLAQAELALAELETGEPVQEELKRIGELAGRGSEIVRQLMVYAGKETEASGVADVSATVKDMLELLRLSISKQTVLVTDLRSDLPAVRAGGAQIRQIVMNLVTNASEAIGQRDGVIRVEARREREYVQLHVSDTGCGMMTDTQAKVFDPFFTTKSAGRGLGLAVVQGIVRSLGGAIHITSEVGKGTTFQILLPVGGVTAPAIGPSPGGSGGESAGSRPATLLMVEDEDLLRESVVKMLRKTGFSVLEAADGTAALHAVRASNNSFDAIVLDITLPGASSREVYEEARRRLPGVPVIVTTAYSEDFAAAALNARCEHFIRKPYPVGDLVALIRKALGRCG